MSKKKPRANTRMTIETVTPAIARKYLGHNYDRNRGEKKRKIIVYANDMRADAWELNGVPIVFDAEGTLIDGQNRLHACIIANKSFTTYICRGVRPKEGFRTIDAGASRSTGDYFKTLGHEHYMQVAAVTRKLDFLRSRLPSSTAAYRRRCKELLEGNRAVEAYLDKNPKCHDAARLVQSLKLRGIIAPSLLGALWVEAAISANEELATEFATALSNGADLPAASPILRARERLMQEALGDTARVTISFNTTIRKLNLLARAWNYWITGTRAPKGFFVTKNNLDDIPPILGPDDKLKKAVQVLANRKYDARQKAKALPTAR